MAALLRHAAARRHMVQRLQADGRRRLGPRFMHTDERIPEGEKRLKDLSDQVSPTPGGFDWRQITFEDISKGVGAIGNTVIKGCLVYAVASQCDVDWLLGRS